MRYIEKACWQVCDHKGDREVEAFRFQIDPYMPDWFLNMMISREADTYPDGTVHLKVKHRTIVVPKGYYIVKGGIAGVYANKPEMFLAIYEKENKKMKKVFISVAVRGLNEEQTKAKHEEYRNKITEIIGEYEDISINNPDREPFTGITAEKPAVYWLGLGLQKELAKADLAIFCGDISNTRGCKIEKLICELYNIPHIVINL